MKRTLFGFTAAALLASGSASGSLLITGTFDGGLSGGLPKVVELYATSAVADLSLYGVGSANNGGGTDGVELILSGSASAGDFIYIVDTGSGGGDPSAFATYFGLGGVPSLYFDGNFSNGGAASINGDDAVELFFDGSGAFAGGESVIDVFGDINVDGTGQPWEHLDGWAYRNNGTGPDGSTFVLANWTFSGINVTDGASTNAELDPEFPIGTYVPEPGSLALLGLGGLLIARRRRG